MVSIQISQERPQYVVFDREMNIVYKGSGPNGEATAEEKVLELLQQE